MFKIKNRGDNVLQPTTLINPSYWAYITWRCSFSIFKWLGYR